MTTCSVCRHGSTDAIASALLGGQSVRAVADRFEVSKSAVHRHLSSCLAAQVAEARREGKRVAATELVERIKEISAETRELLEESRGKGEVSLALKAIARLERQLELEAQVEGELDVPGAASAMANITLELHPDWIQLRDVILDALRPHPTARLAVVRAIDERKAG